MRNYKEGRTIFSQMELEPNKANWNQGKLSNEWKNAFICLIYKEELSG